MNITPRRPRGIYLLPNLLTITSVLLGFYAITSAIQGRYHAAVIAIFVAMIMDSLDGRIARLTNTMTSFGAQLDSMADMVSFALAPAVLAYTWGLNQLGKGGWVVAFIYVASVALRLARFNTQIDGTGSKRYFQGLPCPTGAAIIIGIIMTCLDFELTHISLKVVLAFASLMVSLLMVSNVRYRSFKDLEMKNHVRFLLILLVVLVVALIALKPELLLFIFFAGYTISGPIATIWGLRRTRLLRKQSKA